MAFPVEIVGEHDLALADERAAVRGDPLRANGRAHRLEDGRREAELDERRLDPLPIGGIDGSEPRRAVSSGSPAISGWPLSVHGPSGLELRARPIASAPFAWRAVKHSQNSSPTFAISGAQKSATLRPLAAQPGSCPWGKTNPRGSQCSRSLEWRIGKASGASLDVATSQ